MGKLLNTKDILLLGLAGSLDIFEEVKDPFHIVSSSYKQMYGWVPDRYRKHNFYQLVSRSIKTDLIEKVEKDGEMYIRITSKGRGEIKRDFPLISFQKKDWDGKWRMIMFDIDEVNKNTRDQLRRKLKELGFGMLQKSVFISPHDLLSDFIEFSKSRGIKDYIYFLETDRLIVKSNVDLASRVWKLDELNQKYKDIVEQIEDLNDDNRENGNLSYMTNQRDRDKKSDSSEVNNGKNSIRKKHKRKKDSEGIRIKIRNDWLAITTIDPYLPERFLPNPWYGKKAREMVRSL
jgi:phenylacetic acid degradation operon negative regulatory protein